MGYELELVSPRRKEIHPFSSREGMRGINGGRSTEQLYAGDLLKLLDRGLDIINRKTQMTATGVAVARRFRACVGRRILEEFESDPAEFELRKTTCRLRMGVEALFHVVTASSWNELPPIDLTCSEDVDEKLGRLLQVGDRQGKVVDPLQLEKR